MAGGTGLAWASGCPSSRWRSRIRSGDGAIASCRISRFDITLVDTPDGLPPREILQLAMAPSPLRMRLRRRDDGQLDAHATPVPQATDAV